MACEVKHPDSDAHGKLDALIQRLESEADQDAGGRTDPRRSVHAPVMLGVLAGGFKPLYRCWATDLSTDGLGILCEHEVPVGSLMYVNLGPLLGESLVMQVRICYVSRLLEHTYRIGATFTFVDSDPSATRLSA